MLHKSHKPTIQLKGPNCKVKEWEGNFVIDKPEDGKHYTPVT